MTDHVFVVLGDDFYSGPEWKFASHSDIASRNTDTVVYGLYRLPREQIDRWVTVTDAYAAMQNEIASIMQERGKRQGQDQKT